MDDTVVFTHDENGTDRLIGVPARDLTQLDLSNMEAFALNELSAYVERGGKDWQPAVPGVRISKLTGRVIGKPDAPPTPPTTKEKK